jgi:hypothetical protein
MTMAKTAVFPEFYTVGIVLLVLGGSIIAALALATGQRNPYSHGMLTSPKMKKSRHP